MKERGYLVAVPNIHEYISPYTKQVVETSLIPSSMISLYNILRQRLIVRRRS
jgi:hypothetical protein